jgi:hypothetical protein
MSKWRSQKFHAERFNLKELNGEYGKVQYRTEIRNRFPASEDTNAGLEINNALENIKKNIKIATEESTLLWNEDTQAMDRWRFPKIITSKEANQTALVTASMRINSENPNTRSDNSRPFRNKKRKYLKGKMNALKTNIKNKNIWDMYRGLNEFKKGHESRSNLV